MKLFLLLNKKLYFNLLVLNIISYNRQLKKNRAYHSWQLAFRNPADFMCEIRTKSRRISPECELLRDDQV